MLAAIKYEADDLQLTRYNFERINEKVSHSLFKFLDECKKARPVCQCAILNNAVTVNIFLSNLFTKHMKDGFVLLLE